MCSIKLFKPRERARRGDGTRVLSLYEWNEIDVECAKSTKFTLYVHLFTYFIDHDYHHHLRRWRQLPTATVVCASAWMNDWPSCNVEINWIKYSIVNYLGANFTAISQDCSWFSINAHISFDLCIYANCVNGSQVSAEEVKNVFASSNQCRANSQTVRWLMKILQLWP